MKPEDSTAKPDSTSTRQSRLAPVIERSPLPMIEVEGREHIVRYVNSAFCALLGKRRDELIGQPFEKIVCNGGKCIELLDRVYATGEGETLVEPDASTPAYWLYAMWPALDEKQRPERVVIQLTKAKHFRQNSVAMNEALLLGSLQQHDLREAAEKSNVRLQDEITARKRVEAMLHGAQDELQANAVKLEQMVAERTAQLRAAMAEMEAFAYSMAHDLRAPLRAIHGFAQLALEMPPAEVGRSAAELLQRVVTAAIRMDSLIQDVLLLSNVIRKPITLSSVDVDALVHALLHERVEFSPPQAEIRVESPLLPVFGHEATLGQCLTNLLGNAVKFVRPGVVPRVRVWTEERAASTTDVTPPRGSTTPWPPQRPGHPVVRLWVEDQGIGIPPEAGERVFEIFQRLNNSTQYEGSGIGLAIVRKAIERMGGRVGFESEPSKGSRFWLELPKG